MEIVIKEQNNKVHIPEALTPSFRRFDPPVDNIRFARIKIHV